MLAGHLLPDEAVVGEKLTPLDRLSSRDSRLASAAKPPHGDWCFALMCLGHFGYVQELLLVLLWILTLIQLQLRTSAGPEVGRGLRQCLQGGPQNSNQQKCGMQSA